MVVVFGAVGCGGLDDEECAARAEGVPDMTGCANRVAHVMQAVEQAHQVVGPGELTGPGDLEGQPVPGTCLGCPVPGRRDGTVVVVEAVNGAVGVGLCEQDGGGAVAAADVRHPDAALEPLGYALERRQPG